MPNTINWSSYQSENNSSHGDDPIRRPPIERRAFFALLSIAGSLAIMIFGWNYFDRYRRLLGSAMVGVGELLGLLGFGLLGSTVFPPTWDWWL